MIFGLTWRTTFFSKKFNTWFRNCWNWCLLKLLCVVIDSTRGSVWKWKLPGRPITTKRQHLQEKVQSHLHNSGQNYALFLVWKIEDITLWLKDMNFFSLFFSKHLMFFLSYGQTEANWNKNRSLILTSFQCKHSNIP